MGRAQKRDVSTPTGEDNKLLRRLGLPHLILYGLGVTVGAGIYVLIGLTAAEAGIYAPVSFLVAAGVVSFTGLTYAELSTRYPVSAGETIYVQEGLKRRDLAVVVGLLVAASGVVSSATIAIGASSYLSNLVPINPVVLIIGVILLLGLVAIWGVLESVTVAATLTVVEVVGLLAVIIFAFTSNPDVVAKTGQLVPPFEGSAWAGIFAGSVLAFFAFIGFEDLANIAEEAKNPRRNMPLAILLTLLLSTVLYLGVVSAVVLTVPMAELKGSTSPLLLVFTEASPTTLLTFNVIAVLATINGILIQMIMSSRILYGLSKNGYLPKSISHVSKTTGTPVFATIVVVIVILVLALFLPVEGLAEWTSRLALLIFCIVNIALIGLKKQKRAIPKAGFTVPMFVPVIGLVTSALLLIYSLSTLF